MNELSTYLEALSIDGSLSKQQIVSSLKQGVTDSGYTVVDLNDKKPWGAYIRMNSAEAGRFIADFFPGLTLEEAKLGMENAELSPKILLVAPHQRLSLQYHNRRAERWAFLTEGGYYKSSTDEPGELIVAQPGTVVQFQKGERHRLAAVGDSYAVVAEIWQHTDPTNPSNEDDIVRLSDDYKR
jgi:mannose-6-phosphate isomerase-like protein (cupin superfamily)